MTRPVGGGTGPAIAYPPPVVFWREWAALLAGGSVPRPYQMLPSAFF